jgi:hypothetical protein
MVVECGNDLLFFGATTLLTATQTLVIPAGSTIVVVRYELAYRKHLAPGEWQPARVFLPVTIYCYKHFPGALYRIFGGDDTGSGHT